MNDKYILRDGNPVPCEDSIEWARFFAVGDRVVEKTSINTGVDVSTVFLALDHSFGGPVPILWETMIFGGPHDGYQERYTNLEDAKAGHEKAVRIAKGQVAPCECGLDDVTPKTCPAHKDMI